VLKNENIICISSIDWDFNWQGHQEIMATFAKNGNRVLFIENTGVRAPNLKDIQRLIKRTIDWFKSFKGFRNEMENLYVYSPVILPFPYSRIARWINNYMLVKPIKRWMEAMEFYDPIVWSFLPTGTALDIIDNIDKKLLVYYCIADFNKLVGNPKKVMKTESKLIRKSNLIFAQGKVLQDKCKRLNDNVYISPFGVKIETFKEFQHMPDKVPNDIKNINSPIIGYIGGIHKEVDFGLIKFIAEVYPEWSLVLVGPVQTDISKINSLPNVFLLGKKDFLKLPDYISKFDVAIIPYAKSGYTMTVFPTKLNEYLAMGKPVVSSYLPEIETFNEKYGSIVYVAKNQEEFARCIERAINEDNGDLRKRRIEVAEENGWQNRIEQMSNLIKAEIERKKLNRAARWKENLLDIYRVTRRRLVRVGLICLLSFVVFLKTPFIWFIASPLKIADQPQKADTIVVFGGGVGETGSPGKSTIERARYAVGLYRQGYAKKIIFSSGYTFRYNDAENMKLFALSMGVPEEDILLEQKANSTYENVKFSKLILDKNGWDTVLLVSSPYNMARASLVFRKLADRPEVIYTPVSEPQFYHTEGTIKWEQFRAIFHEYLGILYYWWKGYI